MKLLFILAILNLSTEALSTIRGFYNAAIESEASALRFEKYLKSLQADEPIVVGYIGANKMLLAKYAILPTQKYAHFSEGRQKLDKAIAASPESLELRFLRYSTQLNSPSFLGYNKEIAADRALLINKVASLSDHELKVKIISFLVVSGGLSDAERILLK